MKFLRKSKIINRQKIFDYNEIKSIFYDFKKNWTFS